MDATSPNLTNIYYVGTHPYSFRAGEPALIVGGQTQGQRHFYVVRYTDGTEDLKAMRDAGNYRLISRADVEARRIPAVSDL